MIWLSMLLVFGILAVTQWNLAAESPDLHLGAGQIIAGRVPWLLLGGLWAGVALGVASLRRGRKLPRLAVLLLEIPPVVYLSWYVFFGSVLPAHDLAIEVGDPFPAYALEDHTGTLREVAGRERRPPALYVFYRGPW